MEFFPFRSYYYSQNRYIPPYGGMQNRRNNIDFNQNRRVSHAYEDTKPRENDFAQTHKYGVETNSYETKKNEQMHTDSEEQSRGQFSDNNLNYDKPIFEIFGIKLFFDDILIISLIFFLYNEGVRDNLLFISLILILLS